MLPTRNAISCGGFSKVRMLMVSQEMIQVMVLALDGHKVNFISLSGVDQAPKKLTNKSQTANTVWDTLLGPSFL